MQQSLNNEYANYMGNRQVVDGISFLVGDERILEKMLDVPVRKPFDGEIIEFLDALSKKLRKNADTKSYPDVVTLCFWMRKASILRMKEEYMQEDGNFHVGRGVAFHIAPSNVPVNYMYSLILGLLAGNANIVRVPSKDFPQVSIINQAMRETLNVFKGLRPYICLIRYSRERRINDYLSQMADVRIVWGGDSTIAEIRKSYIGPRTTEVTFADRYSLAVIDSDLYMENQNKERLAEEFYNDTFLTDQNACTSPRIVVWTGSRKQEAKECFWSLEHILVKQKYAYQSIMGINKLTSSYLTAVALEGAEVIGHEDNLIYRIALKSVDANIMDLKDNSGYFLEYDCDDIMELIPLCNNTHCQTIGFFGKKENIMPLLESGIRGVDRVVPIGKTMDFDFIWDGYNLMERLTRAISISI